MTTTNLTNLEQAIQAEREATARRIAKLRRAAADEQRRIDERVVVLLREQQPDVYDRLVRDAGEALLAAKAKRSSTAKNAAMSSSSVLNPSVHPSVEQSAEGDASWTQ